MADELAGESASLRDYVNDPTRKIVLHLAKNVFPNDLQSLALGDFTEADFPGYEAIRLTDWHAEETGDNILGHQESDFVEFQADGLAEPAVITAEYVTVQDGDAAPMFLQAVIYDVPLVLEKDGHLFRRNVTIKSVTIDES